MQPTSFAHHPGPDLLPRTSVHKEILELLAHQRIPVLHKGRSMYAQCTRNVRAMYARCTVDVRAMYARCTRDVRAMYGQCTRNVRADVRAMYAQCARNVRAMYAQYKCI